MRKPSVKWSPEVVERMRALFDQGLKYPQIVRAMPDVENLTQKAVKGKVERLGWRRRVGQIKPPKPDALTSREPDNGKEAQLLALMQADAQRAFDAAEIDAKPLITDPLLLTDDTCRWPYGDSAYAYCGRDVRPREGGRTFPYCDYHQRKVGR